MTNCLNCDFKLEANFKHCPNCGQETQLDESLKSLLSHFLNDYFTFDSKIIRSVVPLVTKPAFLTKEYLSGKRAKYIAPLRLFIFLSLIFFLLLNWFNSSTVAPERIDGLDDDFWDRFFGSWLPKLFFFLLPLFALIIAWLYRRQKKGLMPHFLFALHFHASIFLVGIIYGIISYLFAMLEWHIINKIFLVLVALYLAFYLWSGLRKAYQEGWKKTIWKFLLLAISYSILLVVTSIGLIALSL